jgi:hypothetical protein
MEAGLVWRTAFGGRRLRAPTAEALLAAGLATVLGWATAGCAASDLVIPAPAAGGGLNSGLVLVDSMTQRYFSLSVVNGSPTLTEIGAPGTTPTEQELTDGVTGAHFSLAVNDGALTLVPGPIAATAAKQIELVDTVTAKTYELAVISGGLTLTPG